MITYTALLALISRPVLAEAHPPHPTITSAPSCDLQKRSMCVRLISDNADRARKFISIVHAIAVILADHHSTANLNKSHIRPLRFALVSAVGTRLAL